ncbi:MAG: thiamine pyrophosphate-binding protein, partial [Ruthenibacterium sp.]
MKLKLAQYIADFLVEQDVRQNFTVTGGGAMHLNDAFGHKQGMHCIYNHNEQASAIAAEAYARVAGKPALCCVTSGPGGTNAITGVMGGWLDSVPMLILSGQVKRETTVWSVPELHLRQLGDQEFDIVNSVRNMTKYCAMVTEPNDIAYHLEKALYLCTAGRPGPVWLDIPLDVQGAQIETDALRHFDSAAVAQVENPVYHTAFTPQILEHLTAAKRPVLFVGEGVFRGKAQETLLQLVQKLQIPVVTAWNAHDLVPDENPYYCGRPGSLGTR